MKQSKQEVIAQYYSQHAKSMFVVAMRALGDRPSAEVAVQETFIVAMERYDKFTESPNPDGWLYNTLRNMIRRQQYEHKMIISMLSPYEGQNEGVHNDVHSPYLLYQGTVDDQDLKLLIDFYCHKLEMNIIAESLGITPNAARVRLHRAKKRFLEAIKSQI